MEHSKKILFGFIAFVVFTLIIILCLYSYNSLDTANAYTRYKRDSSIEQNFPFDSSNVVFSASPINYNYNYSSIFSTSTTSTLSLSNTYIFANRSNFNNSYNKNLSVTNHVLNFDSYFNLPYNTFSITGGSNFTSYVNRVAYPVNLLQGHLYYINFYVDTNYIKSNLDPVIDFYVANNAVSPSGSTYVDSVNLDSIILDTSYYINDFLFFSIAYTPSVSYSALFFHNRFLKISLGLNVSTSPTFVNQNIITYDQPLGVAENNFIPSMSYTSGVNYYWTLFDNDINSYITDNNGNLLLNMSSYDNLNKIITYIGDSNRSLSLTFSLNGVTIASSNVDLNNARVWFYFYGDISNYDLGYSIGYSEATSNLESELNYKYGVGYNAGYNLGYTTGLSYASNSSFLGLLTASIESPLNAVLNMFDFEILGYNMKTFYLGLFSVALILFLIKVVLGNVGGKKGD